MNFSIIDDILRLSKKITKPFNKESIIKLIAKECKLRVKGKIYYNDDVGIRFSNVRNGGYSNTFLSFNKILEIDDKPLIACIIRNSEIEFLLANSTFINKISHSSKLLNKLNIRGSVNLSNIIKNFSNYKNEPTNFVELFKLHSEIPQRDNVERIVENTKLIKAQKAKFLLSDEQKRIILSNVEFIKKIETDDEFLKLNKKLIAKVFEHESEILQTAKIDNVNLRGNAIEQLITGGKNFHELGDISETIKGTNSIIIDVKSKLLNLSSAPKAYNIDKMLEAMTKKDTYFGYLFIGVNYESSEVKALLLSFIDKSLIESTIVQHHWSSINSRGTAQLSDDIKKVFDKNFQIDIDIEKAKEFLTELIHLN